MISIGVRFGCVLADAGYGLSASFLQGLTARKLAWAVGVPHRAEGPTINRGFNRHWMIHGQVTCKSKFCCACERVPMMA
jgi:hypothetical protein